MKIHTYEEAYNASLEYFNGDDLAAKVFLDKYSLRNLENELLEKTPRDMHCRLAKEFARVEKKKYGDEGLKEEEIFGYFDGFKYLVAQGSPMFGIGNNYTYQSLGNCFTLGNEPCDSYCGIMYADQMLVHLFRRRAGAGICLDNIRPKGLVVKNAAKTTDGIGIFMERFSNTTREVAIQNRRGALLQGLSVHHPEIETFINIKKDLKKVTGSNISVLITNEFMDCVKSNKYYEQKWPLDSNVPEISNMVPAKKIWDNIIDSCYNSAEPGIIFIDNSRKYGLSDQYKIKDDRFKDIVSNPCLTGDTLVYVADGRGNVPIKTLVDEDKDVPVFCLNNKNKITIKTMRHPRLTGKNKKIFKVTLDDGSTIRCTENHKLLKKDGEYCEVKNLKNGDSLSLLTRYEAPIVIEQNPRKFASRKKDYIWLRYNNTNCTEHNIVAQSLLRKTVKGEVVHHKDHNTQNNKVDNLEIMTKQDHDMLHAKDMIGDKNPMRRAKHEWSKEKWDSYRKNMSKATSGKNNARYINVSNIDMINKASDLTKKLKRRFSAQEWYKYAKENGLPVWSKFREKSLGNLTEFSNKIASDLGFKINLDPRILQTELDMQEQGYDTKIENNTTNVKKSCELCNKEFWVAFDKREMSFCGSECVHQYLGCNSIIQANRKIGNKKFQDKQILIKIPQQVDIFLTLKSELNRNPYQREWEARCKTKDIPFRVGRSSPFKKYSDLKEYASNYNHKVVSVEFDGYEDVYNGTVDEHHNFFVGGWQSTTVAGKPKSFYINNLNCGEVLMGKDSCRLMVLNLYSYVDNPFTKSASFNYKLFQKHSNIGQRLMDDLVDLEIEKMDKIISKVKSDPEPQHIKQIELDMWKSYKEVAVLGRRTGLGVTALGDSLAALNIKYGSQESIDTTEKIYKQLAIHSMMASCEMAKELGTFPLYDSKLEKDNIFLNRLLNSNKKLKELHNKYGRRNISLTTTAPAGTVSILTQTTSGIEPVFMLEYTRRRKINHDQTNAKIDYVDDMGDSWEEYPVKHHGLEKWMKVTGETDISKSPYHNSTSENIDWERSVDIQAAAQKWVSHSISKTCNVPKNTSKELISKIYMRAYDKKLKGFTIYREGSRSGVLVSNKTEETKRPKELPCDVYHVSVKSKRYFVLVGLLNDKPYEVFCGINGFLKDGIKHGTIIRKRKSFYKAVFDDKDGTELTPLMHSASDEESAITRLTSLALRNGTPINDIVTQLENIGGDFQSFSKAIIKALKRHIKDGCKVDDVCPECNNQLIRIEGCKSCKSCGWSKC